MNLYGYASGDPINFSDPFGLCPDSLRAKNNTCPGGLSVKEWNAVEAATRHMDQEGHTKVRRRLYDGRIRSADLDYPDRGEVTPYNPRTMTFDDLEFTFSPAEFAEVLLHESRHVDQFKGKLFPQRIWMVTFKRGRYEEEAEKYAKQHLIP